MHHPTHKEIATISHASKRASSVRPQLRNFRLCRSDNLPFVKDGRHTGMRRHNLGPFDKVGRLLLDGCPDRLGKHFGLGEGLEPDDERAGQDLRLLALLPDNKPEQKSSVFSPRPE